MCESIISLIRGLVLLFQSVAADVGKRPSIHISQLVIATGVAYIGTFRLICQLLKLSLGILLVAENSSLFGNG